MSPSTYARLYWAHVHKHPWQEVLAGAGIMIGVALAFAVMVANGSISASSDAVVRSVIGTADWQLASRDANGFDAHVLDEVRRIRGVRLAAPVLDQRAVVRIGDRRTPVNVASITPDLAEMSGRFGALATGLQFVPGVMLTTAAAERLGIPAPTQIATTTALPRVTLDLRGRALRLPVAAVLGDQLVGPLADTPAAVVPLRRLQTIAGLERQLTRVLVDARAGHEQRVHGKLARIAARHHLALTRADIETALLRQALGPSDWTTGFFAAISALLGFLLAFNAMLLTAPERRRTIALMRLLGASRRQVTIMVISQAVTLGLVGSLAGVALGAILAKGIFNASPGYLAPAFVPSAQTVVSGMPVLIALVGGVAASIGASFPLFAEIRRRELALVVASHEGDDGNVLGSRTWMKLLAIAALLAAVAVGLLRLEPAAALGSVALLACATVCATPAMFRAAYACTDAASRRRRAPGLLTAVVYAMRSTKIRSLALAATGAVAVFGCISIEGARTDLLRGIGSYTDDYVGTADLWIVNDNDNQATGPIALTNAARIAATVPGVAAARAYQGSFLDWSGRRVWIIARPVNDPQMLPASQIRAGDIGLATRRLRAGGWAAVSDQLADRLRVGIGGSVVIPTPTGPARFRIAALTTNLGWTPGAISMNTRDYRRAWADHRPSAIEIDVNQRADTDAVRAELAAKLGDGLRVQSAAARAAGINASAHQGLARLRQISMMLLLGAVLAMGAALSAAIWQRRSELALSKILGLESAQVWRALLIETGIVIGAGCVAGALVGLVGQLAIDRYLIAVTGFPVDTRLVSTGTLEMLAAVLAAALAVVAGPGWKAATVPPALGLQRE